MLKKLLIILSIICLPISAMANPSLYDVIVSVDVTDVDSSKARERAMLEANRGALKQVIGKVASASAVKQMSNLTNNEILNFVKEVSVISEKVSDVRYIADLKISINDKILKAYMDEKNIASLQNLSNSNILIIPTFREFETDMPKLWEEGNIWKQAWENNPKNRGVIKFTPIQMNAGNYASIDGEKAVELNGIALDKLMRLNRVDNIYVADAYFDGIEGLIIRLHSYNSGDKAFETIKVAGDRSVPSELFSSAVDSVKNYIAEKQKQHLIKESSKESQVIAMYVYDNLRDLVNTEKTLNSISQIKNVNIDATGANKAQFRINYTGSSEKLLQNLHLKSFETIDKGSFIIISKNTGV